MAITRAKSKLIIIGSKSTFGKSEDKVLEGLVKVMDDQGWMQDLPVNAAESHKFEGGLGTQTQTQGVRPRGRASQPSQETRSQKVGSNDKENQGIFRKASEGRERELSTSDKLLEKRPVMRDIINGIERFGYEEQHSDGGERALWTRTRDMRPGYIIFHSGSITSLVSSLITED